ncbi:hypothetical protein V6N11_008145 [Hibiscus sabdariffa]|uniref:Nucleotide-binding alpha-beta plait domain-containing protein n=1 Tax=Hibiscus sabdariffa TaxID=183260 RepID=A0ABR2PZY2_9ROSI
MEKPTFVFVRFGEISDAKQAIARSNGRRMDGFHIKVRDFRSFKEALIEEGKPMPARVEVQASRNDNPVDTVVSIVDLVNIKVSTASFEEEQQFIDDVLPVNHRVDGANVDSEFEAGVESNCDEDAISEDPFMHETLKKGVGVPALGIHDTNDDCFMDPSLINVANGLNGSNLYDVNVISGGSSFVGGTAGPGDSVGPVPSEPLDQSDSLSHCSRLHEVHVGTLNEEGPPDSFGRCTSVEPKFEAMAKSRRGGSVKLRAGIDKFN